MNTFKICTTRDHSGNHGLTFIDSQNVEHKFRMVGRTWKHQSEGWSARRTVISVNGELYAFDSFKSKLARPLALGDGEVYLPLSVTGGKMLLAALPE